MYYPMLKHWTDQLCIRRTPLSVFGTSGGRLGHKTTSPRMSLNKCPKSYAIHNNIIIRSKHDASARQIHAIPYTESTVTA